MTLNYGELLRKAWTTIWKHKIFWIFGILASCSARSGNFSMGGSSSYRSPWNFNNNNFNFNQNTAMPPAVRNFYLQLQHLANTGQLWQTLIVAGVILLLLVVILRLIMAAVGTIGQIGLINGTWQLEDGAEKIAFRTLVSEGWRHFWKVILFKLILMAVNLVVGIVLVLAILLTLGCAVCLLFLPLVVFSFVYWILVEYILVGLVGDSLGIKDAISKGWGLFKNNWVTSTLMGLLVGVIEFAYGMIILIPLILVLVPGGIGIFTAISTRSDTGLYPGLIASGILLLIFVPIAIFLNGVKTAFLGVNWTLVYRQLTGRNAQLPVETVAAVDLLTGDLPPAEGIN